MNFKQISMLACAVLCTGIAGAQNEFTLTVRPEKAVKTDKLFLMYRTGNAIKCDSASLDGNQYVIKGNVPFVQKGYAYISPGDRAFWVMPKTRPGMPVYLEKGSILMEVADSAKSVKISGTKLNDDYQTLQTALQPFMIRESLMEKDFNAAKGRNDTKTMEKLQQDYQTMVAEQRKVELKFFKSHLDSEISLDWLVRTYDINNQKSEAETLFKTLSPRLRETMTAKVYASRLAQAYSVETGSQAPGFTAKDPEGKDVSLTDFRGKYVLVDFWASWCGPCRRENPNVVKAYNHFKSDKFEIIGVSLDNSKAAWTTAIAKDGLKWTQVSDLAGWQSAIASAYAVHAIPANFLIDPQGKIIAKDLRGEALENKLKEVLK